MITEQCTVLVATEHLVTLGGYNEQKMQDSTTFSKIPIHYFAEYSSFVAVSEKRRPFPDFCTSTSFLFYCSFFSFFFLNVNFLSFLSFQIKCFVLFCLFIYLFLFFSRVLPNFAREGINSYRTLEMLSTIFEKALLFLGCVYEWVRIVYSLRTLPETKFIYCRIFS